MFPSSDLGFVVAAKGHGAVHLGRRNDPRSASKNTIAAGRDLAGCLQSVEKGGVVAKSESHLGVIALCAKLINGDAHGEVGKEGILVQSQGIGNVLHRVERRRIGWILICRSALLGLGGGAIVASPPGRWCMSTPSTEVYLRSERPSHRDKCCLWTTPA